VDLVQLALHLTKRASIGQSVNLNETYNTYTEYTKHDLGTPLSMAQTDQVNPGENYDPLLMSLVKSTSNQCR
jgi:hypothetical protein